MYLEKTKRQISHSINRINGVINFIFPLECLGCRAPGDFICDYCIKTCVGKPDLVCPGCALLSPVGGTHPGCLTAHVIDGIFSAASFHTPFIHEGIKYLKYKNVRGLAATLVRIINEKLEAEFGSLLKNQEFVITYVPLYPSKQRRRGYNQSELLANALASMRSSMVQASLIKTAETRDQVLLKKEERLENVRGVFRIAQDAEIKNKNFLIVDDVCTTGATLKECAKVLKRNGAGIVWGVTVAKD